MVESGSFDWLRLLVAALGGGLTVKALDIAYQEFRHRSDRTRSAEQFVDRHFDPLLKSADELVGKLRSLAESDFRTVHGFDASTTILESHEFSSILYLFGRFWSRIEILREEGLSVAMGQIEKGKQLQSFLNCLESRRVRIVDRISQRAVGEAMIAAEAGVLATVPFIGFVKRFETNEETRRWLFPLLHVLSRTRHTSDRQRILQYGAVVHALIDTLDPDHLVTRSRPSYANKLTKRTWRDLKYRVFGTYLPFVPNPEKYFGSQKKK